MTEKENKTDLKLYDPQVEFLPEGKPFSEWVMRWWKWILETPASESPLEEHSFHYEKPWENQPYHKSGVWFLAGAVVNDGTRLQPKSHNMTYRSIVGMPKDKSLLMPVLNYFGTTQGLRNIEALEERVKEEMDIIDPETLLVEVDGQRINGLHKYRCDTGLPFEITIDGKGDNILGKKHVAGKKIKLWAKGDGYWLFLKPLQEGRHRIHSFGACRAGRICVEVQYKLATIDSL